MGLDMYLDKCSNKAWPHRDVNVDDLQTNDPELYNILKPMLVTRGKFCPWTSLFEEVGYWRKANAIHKWFVDHVQNGNDDCGRYQVTKAQLEELLSTCEIIATHTVVAEGSVKNGSVYADGVWQDQYIDGLVVVNKKIAQDLLPTQSGFFFGSTDYDQYYMEDIFYTIDMLTKVLKTTDFNEEVISYCSSW
jgi:hypothetical protein